MLDEETKKTLRKILSRFLDPKKDKAFLFGSRTMARARKWSDIDIGIKSKEKIPWNKLILIEEAFEESDLPYTVDVVDFSQVPKKFKQIAERKVNPLV